MSPQRFSGKVAFVTGAARGMGRAHAVRLASEGADIIMGDIAQDFGVTPYPGATAEDLGETARQVRALGRRCVPGRVDVRDVDGMTELVRSGVAELGRLDIVVGNAGIVSAGRAWELSEAEFDEILSVNVKGAWVTAKVTIPILIEQGTGGVLIMTGSTAGVKGLPFSAHYAASKHGVVGLVRTLALELGQYGIRAVVLHPGATRTGMSNPRMHELIQQNPRTASAFDTTLPVGLMDVEDLAAGVAFLASDEARFITGSELRVEMGGLCR